MIPAALIVTPVAPDVLDVITDDVAPPAPTPNVPSLVTLPSTSVAVMVMLVPVALNETIPPAVNVTSVPVDEFNVTGDDAPENVKSVPVAVAAIVIVFPDSVTVIPVPPEIVTTPEPDVLELMVDVFAPPAPTLNDPSLVTSPSTSVAVMVMLVPVALNETMPPAVNVTSVPVDEFNVTGDDAPENVKSVPVAVAAIVIVFPDSVTVIPVPPEIVIAAEPDVLELMVDVFAPPAPTLNDPSLVTSPSTSVAVNVMVFPVSAIVMIPAASMVTSVDPDVLDEITDVVAVPANTVNDPSLVTLPSTSVAVMVMLVPVALNETIPPAVNVTSVPVDEFNVTGDDAPVNVKSVPAPVAVIVIVCPDSVTVIPVPPAITTFDEPDVLDEISESLAPPANTVNDPSLVTSPSTSVPVMVNVFVAGL